MASNTGKIRASGKRGILSIRYTDRTGRQREESTHQTDWKEAERILANREAAVKNGVAMTPQIGKFTFEDGVALIVGDYEINELDSLDSLNRRIRIGLAPWFGHRRMATITGADLTAYARSRKQAGASNATINREFAHLRRMFTLAIAAGSLLQRPTFPTLTEATPRKGFFEGHEFAAVLRHLDPQHHPWAILAYYSGWRVKSDILTREWDKIDRVHKLVRLAAHETKNNTARVFSYAAYPDLDAAIETCWSVHKATEAGGRIEPRVFVRQADTAAGRAGGWRGGHYQKGDPIKHFRKAWNAACRAAGHPAKHPHDFRRTAARNMDRAGVARTVAKQLIGHLTDEMYARYAIVNEQDLHDAAAQQAAGLARDAAKRAAHEAAEAAQQGNLGELVGELAKTEAKTGVDEKRKLRRVK